MLSTLLLETNVCNWRFEDGVTCPNPNSQFKLDPPKRGWYCYVYPEDYKTFDKWMKESCPAADWSYRFNSGDPIVTVFIEREEEATMFALKWIK